MYHCASQKLLGKGKYHNAFGLFYTLDVIKKTEHHPRENVEHNSQS